MKTLMAAHTDVGQVRTNNEDAFAFDADAGLAVVCDGMGGHNAGEVASQLACEVVSANIDRLARARDAYLASGDPEDAFHLEGMFGDAVAQASEAICAQAADNPEQAGMGTTCTAVYVFDGCKAVVAHVGDSRLWLLSHGKIHQITEDHTYVQELVKRGAITEAEAVNHPQGNILSRALGVQPGIPVETTLLDLDPGDTLMLASDGLYAYFPEEEAMIPMLANADVETAVKQLVDTAVEAGGHDNVTVAAVRIPDDTPPNIITVADRLAVLARTPLLQYLAHPELLRVLGLMRQLSVAAGETLCTPGELNPAAYVVLSGKLQVEPGEGDATTLEPGDVHGEIGLADDLPERNTVTAVETGSVLVLTRRTFQWLVARDPSLGCKLMFSLVQCLSGRARPPQPG